MSDQPNQYTKEEISKILKQYKRIFHGAKEEIQPYWDITNSKQDACQKAIWNNKELGAYAIASDFLENKTQDYINYYEEFEKIKKINKLTLDGRCYQFANNETENVNELKRFFHQNESINSGIGFNSLSDNLLFHSSETSEEVAIILAHDWYPLATGNYLNYLPPLYKDEYQEHRYQKQNQGFFPGEELVKKSCWLYINLYPYFRHEESSASGPISDDKSFYDHWGYTLKKLLAKIIDNQFKIKKIIVWGKLPAYALLSGNDHLNKWVAFEKVEKVEAHEIMEDLNYRYGNMDFEQEVNLEGLDETVSVYLAYHPSYLGARSKYQKERYQSMMDNLAK